MIDYDILNNEIKESEKDIFKNGKLLKLLKNIDTTNEIVVEYYKKNIEKSSKNIADVLSILEDPKSILIPNSINYKLYRNLIKKHNPFGIKN